MPISPSVRKWVASPGPGPPGLGIEHPVCGRRPADVQASQTASDGAFVRSDGGKIYLLEGGRETDTAARRDPAARSPVAALEEHGHAGVKLDPDPRLIMSGGGGAGFLWDSKKSPPDKPAPVPQDPPQVTPSTSLPEPRSAPRYQQPATDKKG